MAITIDSFLAALRLQESGSLGGNYTDRSSTSSASGAYGYIDRTWANYGGFAHAWQAPQPVQDARARADVTAALAGYHGDWNKVAAQHFAGGGWVAAHPDEGAWDVNPVPGTRNPTVRAYVDRVLRNAGGAAAATAQPTVNPYVGNQTGSSIDNSARPADWLGVLDALLNPRPPNDTRPGGILGAIDRAVDPFNVVGTVTHPGQVLDNLGAVVQLVAVRSGLAVVGLMMFGAGLVLLVGPEILKSPVAGTALAVAAPEAAAIAGTVGKIAKSHHDVNDTADQHYDEAAADAAKGKAA